MVQGGTYQQNPLAALLHIAKLGMLYERTICSQCLVFFAKQQSLLQTYAV